MKTLFYFLLLLISIICSPNYVLKKPKRNTQSLQLKVKSCILANNNSSKLLKSAFNKSNLDVTILPQIKNSLSESDIKIAQKCRRETIDEWRKNNQRYYTNKKEKIAKLKKPNFESIKIELNKCIQNSKNSSENLKKLFEEYKDSDLKKFMKDTKETLSKEDKDVVKYCFKAAIQEQMRTSSNETVRIN